MPPFYKGGIFLTAFIHQALQGIKHAIVFGNRMGGCFSSRLFENKPLIKK
ncbi:hypothetical protein ATCC53582_02566 [Novacetimonas hansenii]|nr:hypothetical protein ATCC53582_02566 [Novacetimonas hansenii]